MPLVNLFLLPLAVAADPAAEVAEIPDCCRTPSRFGVTAAAPEAIAVEPTDFGAVIRIFGETFAEYRIDGEKTPVVWPLYGPAGLPMTRSWPLGPLADGEVDDHPHHRSLWFAHGDVNGHDFWHNETSSAIRCREILRREAIDGVAVIESNNEWLAGGEIVLTDRRTLRFGAINAESVASPRYVDFEITLLASEGPVAFGDTKEGSFAVRVPGAMKRKAGLGGRVRNSAGLTDDAAWGRPASWVDYSGLLTPDATGPRGGIAIFAHADSFRPTPRWHVRDYGLFAANPFGSVDFPEGSPDLSVAALAEGESLTLKYRVVLYAGEAEAAEVSSWKPSAR